jgi:hypothetical protein
MSCVNGHRPRNLVGVLACEESCRLAGGRVRDENVRALNANVRQQRMQLIGKLLGHAAGTRITPAESGAVVRADAG